MPVSLRQRDLDSSLFIQRSVTDSAVYLRAKQVERAIIAEFLVIVEVPEPILQDPHFRKAHELTFLCALHQGTSFYNNSGRATARI